MKRATTKRWFVAYSGGVAGGGGALVDEVVAGDGVAKRGSLEAWKPGMNIEPRWR